MLKETRKNVKKVKAKGNEPSPLEFDVDKVFQFVKYENLGNKMTPLPKVSHVQSHKLVKPYDLWANVCNTKANFPIAQLIQMVFSIRKRYLRKELQQLENL